MPADHFGVDDLTATIGGHKALENVSLSIEPGNVLAVIGGDGAGKTTLCRVLVGLLAPTSGAVQLPSSIGYQPAGSGTWGDLTVRENLQFVADAYRVPAAEFSDRLPPLLTATGLDEASDRLAANLSGGMRQKLGVAMALVSQPRLLVLDEPTTGVDPVSRAELWQLISKAAAEGTAVVMTTTYFNEARRASQVLELDEGRSSPSESNAQLDVALRKKSNDSEASLLVTATGVVKSFGTIRAVDGMSLEVRSGEVVGLLGGNGAGKTTLIRCLLALTRTDSGHVEVLGQAPNRDVLRQVGYMPQGLGLYADLSVAENLDFRRRIYGTKTREGDNRPRAPVGELPLGEQRRAAFVATLAHSPRLLVLDEPTSGVGPKGRSELWATIREAVAAGAGALVTTHHLEEAEHCDRLVMMAAGREVASGSLEDVIGGRKATVVEVGNHPAAFDALGAAGYSVALDGTDLRLPTDELESVSAVLSRAGLTAIVREVPASLEETFVALAQ
ncbi:MAG: ATP-binding cassette domain-containing protein [Acidimicrobiia bacterium]